MNPFSIVNASLSTFASGPRQFVVHEAFEMMLCGLGVVLVVVHTEHERDVGIGRGRGDDDLLRAGVEVLLRTRAVGEEAGRLEHDVDAEVAPRHRGRIALDEQLDLLPRGVQHAVLDDDVARERPERRVEPEQVRHRRGVAEIVRGDDVEVRLPGPARRGRSCGRCGRSR